MSHSGVQWLKLSVDAVGGWLSYITHGRIYDRAASNAWYYCFPSIMVNCAGDMAMGFSGTSAITNMGAFCTWRLADGTVPPRPLLIRAGTAYQPTPRWGDYSATTLDPADDWTFWTVQQYADPGGDPDGDYPWRTVIARIEPAP